MTGPHFYDNPPHFIAQDDPDPELFAWLVDAGQRGGSFLQALSKAGLAADWENYPILRPVLVKMRDKFPNYGVTRP